ncbi:exodeoxyribonuclease VII large subunit [Schnuerera ultunensis]|uniref:Exodeoxyribonuclease 7 large subunit n=1 Tax=[Clostridium] ultunense Esp TaxID=1288971 RepID=A0A1M4PNV1_9FIRM|nr:exodeoxyribonuclease VII large subunit [Schnuerera ultunensis]SHD77157.1 Exodeoxyribonuclease 7 large subunit [[Clostridium] ultunense Esp]
MESKPLKVSEVNQYIKRIFAGDWLLSNVKVEGEISNFKHHYSGHMYFSLKDEKGKLRCVMFRNDNRLVNFNLKDGVKVIAKGYISVYEKEGDYQLYVKSIEESGIGHLFAAFEELKRRLEKEGLFDEENKKQLPFLPNKIGVVTSSTGAAIKDIITVIKRRFPIVDIIIYPVLVQGVQAPKEICEGLKYLDNRGDVDVIITGRGGGSIEELFAFNDESIARTIFNMRTPIVSAVGHETDFTIADFVADLRAATPSAAAEIVTPEQKKLIENLNQTFARLNNSFNYIINENIIKLNYMKRSLEFYNPIYQLKERAQEQDNLFRKLSLIIERKLDGNKNKLSSMLNSLNYLNPISSLDRGYGIILDEKNNIVNTVDHVSEDEKLKLLIKDGIIEVKVVKISKGEFYYENK